MNSELHATVVKVKQTWDRQILSACENTIYVQYRLRKLEHSLRSTVVKRHAKVMNTSAGCNKNRETGIKY